MVSFFKFATIYLGVLSIIGLGYFGYTWLIPKRYEDKYYVVRNEFVNLHDKLIRDGLQRFDLLFGSCPHKTIIRLEPVRHWYVKSNYGWVWAVGWTKRKHVVYVATKDYQECFIINTLWHELLHDCHHWNDCYDEPDCWIYDLEVKEKKFKEEGLCH